MSSKAVTREGDRDVVHCSRPLRDQHSSNVLVNNIGVSRQGDNNTVHVLPGLPCPSHARPIATGSTSVFANGKGVGRVDDAISDCTRVAQGSDNVFAGG